MASGENQPEVVHKQLQRVLASRGFARNERMSRFLRFVVERQLEGRDSELKESLIGIEVFGRRPGFDPQQDSTVRSEAARLRARLAEYYLGEGSGDTLVIELPKGGYTPRFRQSETVGETASQTSYEPRTPVRRSWRVVALAGLAVAIAAMGGWKLQRKTLPIHVAVLPLTNVSQDPSGDYFVDGLTHELIRNLSILDGLVVRSQTSSFAFKGKQQNIREAGKQLDAEYILEGSVFRSGRQLRINARLIRVRDDFPVWSGAYDEELTDVFAIQDKISRGIVNGLRLKLGRGRRRYETGVEAYDLYLRARALPNQRDRQSALDAAGFYQQVIAKDPSFAPAYAGLAAAYAASSFQGFYDHTDELMQMRAAAEKAIQLDPLLSEAHQALGMVYARNGQWAQSEKSFRRAIELDPNNALAYNDLSLVLLLPLGRIEEAVREMQIAAKTDPLSPWVHSSLGWVLLCDGRYEEAAGHCEKAANIRCLGRAKLGQGRIDAAIQTLTQGDKQYLGYAYGRAGRRAEAEKFAAAAAPNAMTQALTFAGLGDKDRTLEALDRLASNGAVRVGRALNSPEFALLRGDPRVKTLRKKVGLPE